MVSTNACVHAKVQMSMPVCVLMFTQQHSFAVCQKVSACFLRQNLGLTILGMVHIQRKTSLFLCAIDTVVSKP